MKVLVACEESQEVCKAFRARGHEAYSCDLIEPSGGHPEWHILGDALKALTGGQVVTMDGVTHDIGKWDLLKMKLMGGNGLKITLYGDPRTKKNSARILQGRGGRRFVAPSEAFEEYQTGCLWQIRAPPEPISARVNVRCVYYMATRRKVDLANLIEATCDILVKAGVLADDNSRIVAAHDGSRVDYDKQNPRVEIWIEEMEE